MLGQTCWAASNLTVVSVEAHADILRHAAAIQQQQCGFPCRAGGVTQYVGMNLDANHG